MRCGIYSWNLMEARRTDRIELFVTSIFDFGTSQKIKKHTWSECSRVSQLIIFAESGPFRARSSFPHRDLMSRTWLNRFLSATYRFCEKHCVRALFENFICICNSAFSDNESNISQANGLEMHNQFQGFDWRWWCARYSLKREGPRRFTVFTTCSLSRGQSHIGDLVFYQKHTSRERIRFPIRRYDLLSVSRKISVHGAFAVWHSRHVSCTPSLGAKVRVFVHLLISI